MKFLKNFLEIKISIFFIIFIFITTFFLIYWLLIRPVRIKSFCHKKALDLVIKNKIKECKEDLNSSYSNNFIEKDPWCEKLSEKYGKTWPPGSEIDLYKEIFLKKINKELNEYKEKCFRHEKLNLSKEVINDLCEYSAEHYDESDYEKKYSFCLKENGLD